MWDIPRQDTLIFYNKLTSQTKQSSQAKLSFTKSVTMFQEYLSVSPSYHHDTQMPTFNFLSVFQSFSFKSFFIVFVRFFFYTLSFAQLF